MFPSCAFESEWAAAEELGMPEEEEVGGCWLLELMVGDSGAFDKAIRVEGLGWSDCKAGG